VRTLWSRVGRLRLVAFLLALGVLFAQRGVVAQQPPAPGAPDAEQLLGNILVVAEAAARPLPKIAVYPSLSSDIEDVTLRSVVRRDLDLCGEFELLPEDKKPEGLYLSDSPIDAKAWTATGIESLVRVTGKKAGADKVELRGQAYFVRKSADPVFDKKFVVPAKDIRVESHRVADLLIGALTGTNGGFASHLAFASGGGKQRRIFTIDADGNNAAAASPTDRTAIAPTFGKNEELFYAGSINSDEYKIFTPTGGPFMPPVRGSVYGIAFNKDRSQVALAIGQGMTIKLFAGPDIASVKPVQPQNEMVLHPVFTPTGKLAYAAAGKWGQRIWVDGKAISPDGLFASAPTFCNHPDGIRAVFAAGTGKRTDLVSTGETGGGLARLTQNQGNNSYPACSPDGRLVAFFSTRKSNEGPGLYIMRVDGGRPKRISTLTGDSLRWDPLPKSSAVEAKN
jgi:TolB protein